GAAAGGGRQVDVDLLDRRSRQVVDGDGVGPAPGGDVDRLNAVGVHDDVGHVAGEPQPRAVGRQVDVLGNIGAVELQGVQARLALDGVATVTGVPHEGVITRAHQRHVVPGAAAHQVTAVAADEQVGVGAAVERQRQCPGLQGTGIDRVGAAQRVDGQ